MISRPCKKRCKSISERKMPPSRRKPVIEITMAPPDQIEPGAEVLATMAKLQITKDDRKRLEVKSQLEVIMDRIRHVLKEAGLGSNVPCTPSETELILNSLNAPPTFDIQKRKAQLAKERQIMDLVTKYVQSLDERRVILEEVSNWLASVDDLDKYIMSEEQLTAFSRSFGDIADNINEAIDYALQTTDKINDIGYTLLREAGHLEDEDDEDVQSERKLLGTTKIGPVLLPNTILEEDSLNELENFISACSEVRAVLELSIRSCRTHQAKTLCRTALRQFKIILKVMEKRLAELQEAEEQGVHLKAENLRLQKSSEKWKDELERQDTDVGKLKKQSSALAAQVHMLESENSMLKAEIAEYQEELDTKQTWSASIIRTTSEGCAKCRGHGTADTMRMTESMIAVATQALQAEVESLRTLVNGKTEKLLASERHVKSLEEEVAQLTSRLDMAGTTSMESDQFATQMRQESLDKMRQLQDENEALARTAARLQSDLNCKMEVIEYQERRMAAMREEMGIIDLDSEEAVLNLPEDIKRAVLRMKKEMEMEMHRLKDHLEKEKHRNAASLRKLELTTKEQMSHIHKQALHLLRAINRFKEAVAAILEREDLCLAAGDVRRIPNMPIDEAPSDPRMVLAHMSGNAVELLVNMEHKLSQALMNKRLEVKDNSIARSFATKDLESQMEVTIRAKQASEALAEKYKALKLKLATAEEALSQIRKIGDERFTGLAERYRRLMTQYLSLQKDRDRDKYVFKKDLRDKTKALNAIMSTKDSMVAMVEEQKTVISQMTRQIKRQRESHKHEFQLSVADQQHNLQLLEKAFESNKISHNMYQMTQALLKQSRELNEIKLRNLFMRYITFRNLQTVKEHLTDQLDNRMIEEKKKQNIALMLSRMEGQLEETSHNYQHDRSLMETHRRQLFNHMNTVFCDIISETGILLIPPASVLRPGYSRISVFSRSTQFHKKGEMDTTARSTSSGYSSVKLPPILRSRSPIPPLPSELTGRKMPLLGAEYPQMGAWRLPALSPMPPHEPGPVSIDIPRLMDLDINQHLRAAHKALTRIRYKPTYKLAQVEGYDYHDHAILPIHKAVHYASDMSSSHETATTCVTSFLGSDSLPATTTQGAGTSSGVVMETEGTSSSMEEQQMPSVGITVHLTRQM